jgi:hypothetical protein
MILAALALAAALGTADVERLATYEQAWDESETTREADAREEFRERAPEIVDHFLRGSPAGTRAAAHAFVLRALADVEATLALVRALPDPPAAEEGAVRRKTSEVAALLGPIVDLPEVGRDPRLAAALDQVAREPGPEADPHLVRAAAIALLGRLRSPEAVEALVGRLEDDDATIRTMAVQSLGWMGERLPEGSQARVLDALGARLESDPEPDVRFHAAEAIRHLEIPEGAARLEAALADEPRSEVVDAIVAGLEGLGAPIEDPARAKQIVARGDDAARLKPLFERWRRSATREEIVATALEGPPVLRVLALRSLVVEAEDADRTRGFGEAAPPPVRPVADLPPGSEERLLGSAVAAIGDEISLPTHDAAVEAAWGLAGGSLERLLPLVDEIEDLPRRYFASWSIHRLKPAAYDDFRRNRELLAAGWMALPFALATLLAPLRRFAVIGLLAAAGWGATAYAVSGPLDLPPWPYPLAKVRFLVAATGALAATLALLAPARRRLIAFFGGPLLFLAAYVGTRSQGFFPPDPLEGWIFVFEPAVGVVVTAPVAYLLSLAAVLAGQRRESAARPRSLRSR